MKRVNQITMRGSVPWLSAERLAKCADRIIQLTLAGQRRAKIGQSLRGIGLQFERTAITGDGLVHLPSLS